MYKVIDVSKYQGDINWELAKAQIDGAILRCGYGNDMARQDDSQFHRNAEACVRLGIPFGAYLYSYATTEAAAKSEAAHAIRLCQPYKGKMALPIYYDLEQPGIEEACVTNGKLFCSLLQEAGFVPGIYASQNWFQNYIKKGLDDYSHWVARYSADKPKGISGKLDGWQYTSKGTCAGVVGRVDVSEFYSFCQLSHPVEVDQAQKQGQSKKQELGPVNCTYRAFAGGKWLPEVQNLEDWAGKGKDIPIKAFAIRVDKGSVKYRVWRKRSKGVAAAYPYVTGYNIEDTRNGFAGDCKNPIVGLEIIYLTPKGFPYAYAMYRVSVEGKTDFYPYQKDNESKGKMDGYAGDLQHFIDKIQCYITS